MKQINYELDGPVRLDHYLVETLNLSRSKITPLIKSGAILVNHKAVKPGYLLLKNDVIDLPDLEVTTKQPDLGPVNLKLDIVYEDADILIINKPKSLVVHPAKSYTETTLVSGLKYHTKSLSNINNDPLRPGIVHRIDKDTSGLLVVAKTNDAHKVLAKDLKQHLIKREYIALVDGIVEVNKGVIDAPIGRHLKVRTKNAVINGGKPAITHFEVVRRYQNKTLLRCQLETGRTHQIRVHLAYINHPVVGDLMYGRKELQLKDGQLLHAKALTFNHPITKKVMHFEVPLPDQFISYLEQLD